MSPLTFWALLQLLLQQNSLGSLPLCPRTFTTPLQINLRGIPSRQRLGPSLPVVACCPHGDELLTQLGGSESRDGLRLVDLYGCAPSLLPPNKSAVSRRPPSRFTNKCKEADMSVSPVCRNETLLLFTCWEWFFFFCTLYNFCNALPGKLNIKLWRHMILIWHLMPFKQQPEFLFFSTRLLAADLLCLFLFSCTAILVDYTDVGLECAFFKKKKKINK